MVSTKNEAMKPFLTFCSVKENGFSDIHDELQAAGGFSSALRGAGGGFYNKWKELAKRDKERFKQCQHDYIQTVNAGTSALHLALHLLKSPDSQWPGLTSDDEVLTTAMTCTASNWPVLANGLKLKWVDIDPKTLNMDLDDLARKITPKTKVIILVHWGGYPIDLDRIKQIQDKTYQMYGFKPAIIEDGAHSFGSSYKGKPIGTHGNLTMFSLQAIKHITSGDGGAICIRMGDKNIDTYFMTYI